MGLFPGLEDPKVSKEGVVLQIKRDDPPRGPEIDFKLHQQSVFYKPNIPF